jgi:catechol 2,3-dioxygenase-like lactoylglutathione lyase family enzyme
MIVGIHHAQITIPKGAEEEARDFYCRLLRLKEIPKPDVLVSRGGFWLEVGDRQIHVGTEDNVDRGASKAHIAYAVTDLEHWRNVFRDHEIPVIEGIAIPGMKRFEFRDPFGNRVEFLQLTT